jgi:hypothetical protein
MAEESDCVPEDNNQVGSKNNDNVRSRENVVIANIACQPQQHEEVPMVPLGGRNQHIQLREVFIQELHKKFPGGEPSDFHTTQLEVKDGMYKTELAGKEVEVKLTIRNGHILSKSTIENAKGGRDFFKALNSESSSAPCIPLKPMVFLRQKVENIEKEVLSGKLDELQLQEEMETVIDNPDAPLTPDDRRELRASAVTTLASTSSNIKSANINAEWAEKRLHKAEEDLKKAQDSNDAAQIMHWEAEVERFKTQEALYRVTRDALQKDERSQP